MNVLVVDDEPIVRTGLRSLIDWERHGLTWVGEASDGMEALERIRQEKVDIVVTDILMPRMDGLELIRQLKQSSVDVGILVLSCLDDFAYVKEAMKLGAQDYILKPTMEPEELVENILEIRTQLERERDSREQMLKWQKQWALTKHAQWARKIEWILERGEGDKELEEELFPQGQGMYSLLLCGPAASQWSSGIDHDDPEADSAMPVQVQWGSHRLLLFYPISLRLSGRQLHERCYASAQQLWSQAAAGGEHFVGIGPVMRSLADLRSNAAFHEQQIDYRFYASRDRIIAMSPHESDPGDDILPYDDRSDLLRAIYYDNREAVLHCTERICEHILAHRPSVSKLISFVHELITLAISYARERGYARMDQYEQMVMSSEEYRIPVHVTQLITWLSEVLGTLGDYQRGANLNAQTSNPFIRSALQFIQENYSRNISTIDIADHVKLSRSYFSDLYSREMGESLSETITRIRMGEAKRLLASSELKIYEVAEAVGFSDPRAFAKAFKKIVGCTPKDYIPAGRE